jgi:hypothetical protein
MLCAAALTSVACGDDKTVTEPSASIAGKWVGMYGGDVNSETADYTFFFDATDSTVGVIDGLGEEADIMATGVWTVVGDTVFTDYTYDAGSQFLTKAVLNRSRTGMKGTWGAAPSTSDGGTFSLTQE